MYINFNEVDLAFGCSRVIFEWEEFGLESFRNDRRWREQVSPVPMPSVSHSGEFVPSVGTRLSIDSIFEVAYEHVYSVSTCEFLEGRGQ